MDDVMAFPQSENLKRYLFKLEKKLLERADIVFASSKRLKEKIIERGYKNEVHVINNGIELREIPVNFESDNKVENHKSLFNIVYFGTISEWFDFELLLKLLKVYDDIKFTLIGPSEVKIPKHERIVYYKPVKHDELMMLAQDADAFIMPFKLNDLVLSIDPVKVYEYIAFMKPVFVLKYEETEKFKDFVYLYNGFEELANVIKNINNKKTNRNKEDIKGFLQDNSWDFRVENIYQKLCSK
jgi:hypothetical protein